MKKVFNKLIIIIGLSFTVMLSGCGNKEAAEQTKSEESTETMPVEKTVNQTRMILDSAGRMVEIPETVEQVVCLNVSTLRYTCYLQAQDLVVGVEDYEQEKSISRPYNYLNYELFADLPVIGTNGEHYTEEIISVNPDVIVMSAYDDKDADALQSTTSIPVVLVPGSDKMMDEAAYQTIRIMGEVYGKEQRAQELTAYLEGIKKDLDNRTAGVSDAVKPTVYVGGVSYKGAHGFEGTEAYYGPFDAIYAKNLVDETGQKGPFNVDLEQVLAWNPDIIFVDLNGLTLINEDFATNSEYYNQLKAVQEGKVYSQISFRSSAANLEMALADTYYAASILYPDQFADVDPMIKAGEIFETLLGVDFYDDLKEHGYEFKAIQIGEQ